MKSLKPLLVTFSLLAFTGAYAQDAKKDRDPTPAKPAMSQTESKTDRAAAGASAQSQSSQSSQMSAKKLRGMDVVDAQGKKLGDIEEVVLDMTNGRVHAVVLGFGGFLGLGEKHFAFPVSDLQPAKDKDKLQLNVDKEKLKDREGFAKGKYPAMDDEYWARIGQGDKASAGAGQTAQKQSLVRASEVIGKDVQDKSGQDVGEVQDIVLSADRTRIQHVVLDVEDAGEATLPAKSLSMGKDGDKLVVDMSHDQLKSQAKPAERRAATRDRTRPATSGSTGAGATSGTGMSQDRDTARSESKSSSGASTGTTRTVPIEREGKQSESK